MTTGSAALLEGRRFAGCDLDEDAVALAKGRLLEKMSSVEPTPITYS